MPKAPLPDDVSAFLARPNPAVMATIGPGGPVSVATWYLWEDGRVLVNLDESRKRLEHLAADPRVSLTALADGDWYTHVSLQGRVVDVHDDVDLADIDRLARHYTGGPYRRRDRGRVSVWIEVDRWHGWGRMENTDVDHHRRA
ncbi:TIGR03618 family F420-dependent PPOX class oxidoreductase [Jiangella endophytica]|uniref:TIGR03618 family F420-dependent PPOX class oxidoreductase n=1 Tax=Jiangella endophytica TaxID=1623398 RepID=UPI000E34A5E4|nr:TIGR03618 family F420-dependent PPOX class oxidoreductase [Jiangella endophytica]